MPTPESRKSSEDQEAVVVKKPYSAPTLVELGGDLTEAGGAQFNDGANFPTIGPPSGAD